MNLFRRLFNPEKEAENAEKAEPPAESRVEIAAPPIVLKVDVPEPVLSVTKELGDIFADGATRPLSEDVLIAFMGNGHLTFGQATDVGLVRSNNQDAAYSFFSTNRSSDERPDFGLFVVADGMGGHQDGEKASALTARTVASQVLTTIFVPLMSGDTDNQAPITETLTSAIEKANSEVLKHVPDGGTTVTSAVIIGDLAYIAHVGDSRLYLLTKDSIEQLTRDHSLVQRLIELDQLTPTEAAEHPNKNMLYRALGQSEAVEVDTLTRRLPPKSRLLICSDGLWNVVEDKEILEIARQTANPQEACNKLIALANTRGGGDNVTVLLLHMPG
ncbi:MAG: Stp1/IreP family PP2C-type Ser/Thr phosphatase [Chloroflexota bacterium]